MIFMGLRRSRRLPISQAPRRNPKFGNEMCLGSPFAEGILSGGSVCASLREATRAPHESNRGAAVVLGPVDESSDKRSMTGRLGRAGAGSSGLAGVPVALAVSTRKALTIHPSRQHRCPMRAGHGSFGRKTARLVRKKVASGHAQPLRVT
jgi:hypothetical protein